SSSVQNIQNGLADLSLNGANTKLGGQSSKSKKKWRGRVRGGGDKVTDVKAIDKSKSTHHTYQVSFHNIKIKTTVTNAASKLDKWIGNVYKKFHDKLDNLIVGLAIEWRRTRTPDSRNKVAVLQLCASRQCLIFQFLCCDGIPKSLYDFLGNDKITFAGVGIARDAYMLLVDYNLKVARTAQLGSLAAYKLTNTIADYRESQFHRAGLKRLAREVLYKKLPKKKYLELSNWERDFLKDEQVEYLCLDAFVSFQLGMDLINRVSPVHPYENSNEDPSEPEKVEEEKASGSFDIVFGTF
ncbi:hypothetical protein MKW94_008407, partial [Papaver nudicaule]|nr:hypothetical protein [Papaver nudicaule]